MPLVTEPAPWDAREELSSSSACSGMELPKTDDAILLQLAICCRELERQLEFLSRSASSRFERHFLRHAPAEDL